MKNLILTCALFFTGSVYAGGAETNPLLNFVADSQITQPEVFLKLKDAIIKSQIADTDGGIETLQLKNGFEGGIETFDVQFVDLLAQGGIQVDVEKIKFAGETEDSVLAWVNDFNIPVQIKDEQLIKSPQIQFALGKSFETADWFKPKK